MPESLGASANRQKAMFFPSGDHTGRTAQTPLAPWVRRSGVSFPITLAYKSVRLPKSSLTIRTRSGCHLAKRSVTKPSLPCKAVSGTTVGFRNSFSLRIRSILRRYQQIEQTSGDNASRNCDRRLGPPPQDSVSGGSGSTGSGSGGLIGMTLSGCSASPAGESKLTIKR